MLETTELPTDKVMAEMLEIRFNTKIVAATYMGDSQYSSPEETTFFVDKSALTEDDLYHFKDTSTWEGGNDFVVFWSTDGKCIEPISDPRTDTNEALKLLHWMMFGDDIPLVIRPIRNGWEVCNEDTDDPWCVIPIDGTDFCEAVCKLAAKVAGR